MTNATKTPAAARRNKPGKSEDIALLSDLVGQEKLKAALVQMIQAAVERGDTMEHLLLCAPPRMGKRAFAQATANELGVSFSSISGSSISTALEMGLILTKVQAGDVLFVDEVQGLRVRPREILLQAMDAAQMSIVLGKGATARAVTLTLPRFTVICGTSKPTMVDERFVPLLFRFVLSDYAIGELSQLIFQHATNLGINLEPSAVALIAESSNGLPGKARVLLERVARLADTSADRAMSLATTRRWLGALGEF